MTKLYIFSRSSAVAEKLALDMVGRIKLEDAGFDWKVSLVMCLATRFLTAFFLQILGPDVHEQEYVAWTCDQVG